MINLLVYKYDDYDGEPIGQLPVRMVPMFMEELKANGGGSFEIPLNTAQIVAYRELLEYRNMVKVVVDELVVGAFIIGKQDDKSITQEERVGEKKIVSGEGLKVLFDDASVLPMGGLKRASRTKRSFNFSSEEGAWYKPADWITPYLLEGMHDQNNTWGNAPTEFPTGTGAIWIWAEPWSTPARLGANYFRYKFTVPAEGQYAIYAACDNYLSIWLDGEQLAVTDPDVFDAWHKGTKVTVTLPPGEHVIGLIGANAQHAGFNPAALVMVLTQVTGPDTEIVVGKSGTGNWKVLPFPDQAPAWTTGEVLLKLLDEAEDFGVMFPTAFTKTFTATHDSYGNLWDGALDWSFDVGESYLSVVQKLEELLCDIWIDANSMTINAANKRGVDRSVNRFDVDGITILEAPMKFEKGKNLKSASSSGVGKIKNHLLIRTENGWMLEDNEYDPSTAKYGKLMAKLDTDTTEALSKQLAQVVFAQRGQAEEGASYEVILPKSGKIPWRDFGVGDYVLAPDSKGLLAKRRIVSISVEETETGTALYTMEFDTIFREATDKLNRFMQKTGGGSLGASFSNAGSTPPTAGAPIVIPPGGPIITLPVAPTGLSATSVGAWTSDGMRAVSTATLTWAPVIENTDGSATVPLYYEVWGFPTATPDALDVLAIVPTATAIVPGLQPNTNWTFRVRAFNDSNRSGEFSDDITHTTSGPTTPMPAPEAPDVYSDMGLVLVDWNGELTGSIQPPPQFRYVRVEYRTALGGSTWWNSGQTLPRGGGTASLPGFTVGTTVDIRLIAIDGLGIPSAASPIDSAVVMGVDLGSLDGDIQDAIDAAEEAAEAARESTNMIGDPSFEAFPSDYWTLAGTGVTNVTTSPRSGVRHLRIAPQASAYEAFRYTKPLPCDTGDTFQIRMYAKVTESGVDDYVPEALRIDIIWSTDEAFTSPTTVTIGASLSLSTSAYTLTYADWTVPLNARFFKFRVMMTDVSSDNVYYVDDVRVVQKVGTLLIVDGAIIAQHLAADSVTTPKIQAGAISAEKIQAGAITAEKMAADSVTANAIVAGSIEANHIAAGAIQTNHLSPAVGDELDISANDSVTIIAGQIDTVQGSVNETQDNLEEMQTYYTFGPTGAVVSTPASPFAVAIRNDRIEMLENGNVVSYWNSGQMVVSQLVGEKVILGNHQLEKYSDGTVVRAL